MEYINAIGRRKSSVARVYLSEGTGKITINKKDTVVVSLARARLCVSLSPALL